MTPDEIIAGLRQVQEALIDLGACNIPDCTEPNCNRALSQLPAIIAAVEEQQNTVAGLREDLRQLIRVVLTNPADAAGFIQANYPREFFAVKGVFDVEALAQPQELTEDEFVGIVKKAAKEAEKGRWVVGHGTYARFIKDFLNTAGCKIVRGE